MTAAADCILCAKLRQPPATELVWEFPHSMAFLGPWQFYTGYCVLVARSHHTELFQLDLTERHAFLEELSRLAGAIFRACAPRKMNCELLGNQVPHLHWHLFPRYADDSEHLKPVWVALDRAEREPAERQRLENRALDRAALIDQLRRELR